MHTHGAKKPIHGPPWHTLSAVRWHIPFAVPSVTVTIPHFGSKPSDTSSAKCELLISKKGYRKENERDLVIFS